MRRWLLQVGLGCAISASSSIALADWHEFWARAHADYQRNKAWPEPFRQVDRDSTRAHFLTQIDNGWQLQNTIDEQLFDPHSHELSRAGVEKVKWIITQAPVHRRTVFVLRGANTEETTTRVDSVQQAITKLVPAGPLPNVLVSDVKPMNGAGDYYDQIDRRVRNSIPTPRLPAFAGTGGGNGGGGAASGGGGAATATGTSGSGR